MGRAQGQLVAPQSRESLARLAREVRAIIRSRGAFPIVPFLENVMPSLYDGYEFDVREARFLGDAHAKTYPDDLRIVVRDDVYAGAVAGAGRDRFTLCHELGHLLLHQRIGLPRSGAPKPVTYCDSEWQADAFAGCLLMPDALLERCGSIGEVVKRCGVSWDAARVQMQVLANKKARVE